MNGIARKLLTGILASACAGALVLPVCAEEAVYGMHGNTAYPRVSASTYDSTDNSLIASEEFDTSFQDPTGDDSLFVSYSVLTDGELDLTTYQKYTYTLGSDGLPDSYTVDRYEYGEQVGTATYSVGRPGIS